MKYKVEEILNKAKLFRGDNLICLKSLADNSVDSVVTDPPYGLSFMGKKWDHDVPSVEFWKEVYRVLKPGGHVLSFGGTRTYHRMTVNIEDAGFEIRDQIMWIYGQGFPKSLNIGKAVDKRGGKSISWFGEWLVKWRKNNNIPQSQIAKLFPSKTGGLTGCVSNWELGNNLPTNEQFNLMCETFNLPFKSLEEAEREFIGTKTSGIGKAFGDGKWNTGEYGDSDVVDITKGYSDWEGWGTNLKPANEPICLSRKPIEEKTITENVLKYGTGGLNIDGSKVGNDLISIHNAPVGSFAGGDENRGSDTNSYRNQIGRFPSNVIMDEFAGNDLDEEQRRFFYCPKVSKKERNTGVHESNNIHPTLKPVDLMRYLIKLVTPKNGVVLDPFMGSGSTGVGTLIEDFNFIGMEMDQEYFEIAKQRIENFAEFKELLDSKKKKQSSKKNVIEDSIDQTNLGIWANRGLKIVA